MCSAALWSPLNFSPDLRLAPSMWTGTARMCSLSSCSSSRSTDHKWITEILFHFVLKQDLTVLGGLSLNSVCSPNLPQTVNEAHIHYLYTLSSFLPLRPIGCWGYKGAPLYLPSCPRHPHLPFSFSAKMWVHEIIGEVRLLYRWLLKNK